MKTLIVDDHELFSEGLKLLVLSIQPDIEVSIAKSCREAIALTETVDADLVFLDHYLNDAVGVEAIEKIRAAFPKASIIIVSSEEDGDVIHDAISNGASGYIPKASSKSLLISALTLVLSGGCYIPPQILEASADKSSQHGIKELLTDRQEEVIGLAIKGVSNKAIAGQLDIAEGTVKAHLSNAYRLLGVNNRTEAVVAAAKFGLQIDLED